MTLFCSVCRSLEERDFAMFDDDRLVIGGEGGDQQAKTAWELF